MEVKNEEVGGRVGGMQRWRDAEENEGEEEEGEEVEGDGGRGGEKEFSCESLCTGRSACSKYKV